MITEYILHDTTDLYFYDFNDFVSAVEAGLEGGRKMNWEQKEGELLNDYKPAHQISKTDYR